MSEKTEIRWTVVNPFEHSVVLCQETYDSHLVGDHGAKDALTRTIAEKHVPFLIENPCIIVQDKTHESRYHYWGYVYEPQDDKIDLRGLWALIETDRTPHEVITWIKTNKVKSEHPLKGVVYDVQRGGILR